MSLWVEQAHPRNEYLDAATEGTYVRLMQRRSAFPDSRLDALYDAEGFGGEKTMRAKVVRELIDEIRMLRRELDEATRRHPASRDSRQQPSSGSL